MSRDLRALDGLFASGLRWVRPGGRVKAGGRWWRHDSLLEYVGKQVHVSMNCYWMTEAFATTVVRTFICHLKQDD